MSAFATFAGARIVSGSVLVPLYGMWSGDVSLASSDAVSPTGPLVLGDLTLQGAIVRQAPFGGRRACRLVAGAGGWRSTIPKRQYAFAGGVKLSTILGDAATECGEKLGSLTDTIVGTGYVRPEREASFVLRALAGPFWYVDPNGLTQIQAWPTKTVTAPFTVIEDDGGRGAIEIATEAYASFLPGAVFSAPTLTGPQTAAATRFTFLEDGTFRVEVLTSL